MVRAPDNIVYLTNYWCMKGYDVAIFPREGEATLITLEPQEEDARRTSWTNDIRLFKGYDAHDPRPPMLRSLDVALHILNERGLTGKIGLELSQGTQSADHMVGEPTTWTQGWFDAFKPAAREVGDASGLLAQARAIKTAQEIERMKLANELAALAMEHTYGRMHPGMKESEVAAMFEGFVHSTGIGFKNKVEMPRAFTLVWSGSIERAARSRRRKGRDQDAGGRHKSLCADCGGDMWKQLAVSTYRSCHPERSDRRERSRRTPIS